MNDVNPQFSLIGTRPVRPDGVSKVTGTAKFGNDYDLPGTLAGKVLRSPHPHARIKSIDTSKAEALKDVHAVVTRDDFPEQDFRYVGPARTQINMWHMTRNVLAHEKALYEGHAVAAVADATGRRLMELPMSPPRVKAAIENRDGAEFYLTAGQMRLGGALSRLDSRGCETRIRPF